MARLRERRTVTTPFECRADQSGGVQIRGYAALFDSEAHGEVIRPGAFARTLNSGADVRLLVNHAGVPLARTKSGTLSLSSDATGLAVEASLDPANPTVQELRSALERGDIDQMSFGFEAVQETSTDSGVRELREVKLWDVSVVTYPWYDDTSAELLSAAQDLVEARGFDAAVAAIRAALTPLPAPAAEEPVLPVALEAARAIWSA